MYVFHQLLYPNQKHPNFKNIAAKTLKGFGEKMKSKGGGGGAGLCKNAVEHLKILIIMASQAAKQCGKENDLQPGSSLSK